MPSEVPATFDMLRFEFRAASGACKLGQNLYRLDPEAPLYVANKANLRIVSTGGRGHRYGGEQWERMKSFQAAIRLRAQQAMAKRVSPWPTDRIGYHVIIRLEIGARVVVVAADGKVPHKRRIRASTRCRSLGVDKSCEAILDGLEGVLWDDDERVYGLTVIKVPRDPGLDGDIVHVEAATFASERLAEKIANA